MTLWNAPSFIKRLLQQDLYWLILVIALVGCGMPPVTDPNSGTTRLPPLAQTTSINRLENTSLKDKIVYLRGTVGDRVPLVDGTVYELQDSTGKVWILTKGQPPNSGEETLIKGIVRYKSILLDGRDQGSLYVEQV